MVSRVQRRAWCSGVAASLTLAGAHLGILPASRAGEVPATTAITVTVAPGARQRFAGFGVSLGNWGREYQRLTPTERQQLSRFHWRDLRLKSLRLWLNLNEYAPAPGQRLTSDFRARYIDSGIVADARRNGVVDLLLAPDNAPEFMKVKRPGGPQDFRLKEESLGDYAALIAEFIRQIRDETGVLINVTGVQNEPNDLDRIAPEQMPAVVKALRAALDARGLRQVRIIAPESANVDSIFYDTVDGLKADPTAWGALSGIASHSYSMAATDEAARRIADARGRNTKEYWMTEASDNGPEAPGDAVRAASLASRFLNDMNHRTTHWVHFIGFEVPDPNDNATRILAFTPEPLQTTIFQKYYYYQQLSNTFPPGALFRDSESSLEGDMTWTYGKKPRVTVAAAHNPDGTWGIGISNFTAPAFKDDPQDNGGYPAHTFEVTVRVPELAKSGAVRFAVHRSSGHLTNASEGQVTMRNGELILRVRPLELVTLRSRAQNW